jgi:hypothetical protein
MLALTWGVEATRAQVQEAPDAGIAAASGVIQTGCSSCGAGIFGNQPPLDDSDNIDDGDCTAGCIPGAPRCACCQGCTTGLAKCLCGLYECICCPDPCYEYHWTPVQDSAFFLDSVRPKTQMKIIVDSGWELPNPDRGEFWMPKFNTAPTLTVGPGNRVGVSSTPGKGPLSLLQSMNHEDLSMYVEAGTPRFGMSIQFGYREIDPDNSPLDFFVGLPNPGARLRAIGPVSGFTDLIIGTKSVLLDCELIQLGFGFKTFIPTGNFLTGLGTGHVSLEPSLLATIKLSPRMYMQAQMAYWIPIAGDLLYQSNVWHNHISINAVLWKPCKDIQLVGTAEVNDWTLFQGSYSSTDFLLLNPATLQLSPVAVGAGTTMVSMGPGLRLFVCDKIDVGVGSAIAVTGTHWDSELIRTEFRWRY